MIFSDALHKCIAMICGIAFFLELPFMANVDGSESSHVLRDKLDG
jgi:hypothetical protein